jgi:hypothetical protein
MKRWLTVLALMAGLGILISCKHSEVKVEQQSHDALKTLSTPVRIGKPSKKQFPFDRYLEDQKTNWPEPALIRFANECGVDIDSTKPRYAQNPSQKWIPVKDLSKALKDQETDFYGTVAVWHVQDRVLVEQWRMELDTGEFSRQFICLQNDKIKSTEAVDWLIPVEVESASNPAYGYQQGWKVGSDGKYEIVSRSFVDVYERPMEEPNLDAETRKDLDSHWTISTWKELKLPSSLLR